MSIDWIKLFQCKTVGEFLQEADHELERNHDIKKERIMSNEQIPGHDAYFYALGQIDTIKKILKLGEEGKVCIANPNACSMSCACECQGEDFEEIELLELVANEVIYEAAVEFVLKQDSSERREGGCWLI